LASPIEILFRSNADEVKAQVLGLIPVFDRFARSAVASVDNSTRQRVRAERSAADQTAKEATRAEKEKERATKTSQREIDKVLRESNRLRNAMNSVEVRDWQQKERSRVRASEQASRDIESSRKRMSEGFGRQMGGAFGRVMGTASHVAGIATALGGGFTIADALSSGVKEEATAGQIVRSAQDKGGISSADLQSKARAVAIGNGGRTEDVLRGADAFVQKTGSLKAAVDLLDELGLEAASSGAKLEDLGSTAAEVFSSVGTAAGTTDVMRMLIGQGKAGAVDIRNLAQYGARISSTAGLFEGGVGENIKSFGALSQVAKARGGASDAAEATEAAARLFDEIAQHKDDFEAANIKVKGAGGKLRNIQDILLDTLVANKGDITTIPKLFGRQAGKVERGLAMAFLEGSGGKTDKTSLAAGRASAASLIESYQRPVSQGELESDRKSRLAENEAKLNQATEQLHQALNERLLPKLPELIDKFTQLIPAMQSAVDFFVGGSVWEGVGKAVGVALVAEIVKAGTAKLVSSAFTGLASLLLKSVSGTAVANIAAGVVNVTSGVGGPGGVLDSAGKLARVVAPAGAGLGGLALAGTFAAAGAVDAGILMAAKADEKKGQKAFTDLMALPANTPEEKRSKLDRLQSISGSVQADLAPVQKSYYGMGQYGGAVSAPEKGLDLEKEAFRKNLSAINAEIEMLKAALSGAGPAVTAFADSMKPAGGPAEPAGIPPSRWGTDH
jgi:hypothetical protein